MLNLKMQILEIGGFKYDAAFSSLKNVWLYLNFLFLHLLLCFHIEPGKEHFNGYKKRKNKYHKNTNLKKIKIV